MNKVKDFFQNLGTKGKIVMTSGAALVGSALPTVTAFAAEGDNLPSIGGPIVSEEGGGTMWEKIATGVTNFNTDVLKPVTTVCTENELVIAFLSATFITLGVRILSRVVRAFGRGR